MQDHEQLLGYDQVARLFQKSRRTIEAWAIGRGTPEGFPRPFHAGRHARWRAADIERYIQQQHTLANSHLET
jgi:predicted DNA-binding transcriptional regulator AlpA